MVNHMISCLRASLQAIWIELIHRLGLTKTFPAHAPTLQKYAQVPEVLWSLTSVIHSGSLDPTDPIQAQISKERERMASGELLAPLAALARSGITIVAQIDETGAIHAQHIIELVPKPRLNRHLSPLLSLHLSFELQNELSYFERRRNALCSGVYALTLLC